MRKPLCYLTGVFLLAAAALANAAELGVLAPVLNGNDVTMRARPDGKGNAPLLTRVRSGRLYDAIQREAGRGTTAAMLDLDELAMRIAGQDKGVTWLMLAEEDGGFARRGFWLDGADGARWVDEAMVDLVVDDKSVEDGSFEEIFAHELGHVILRRLMPNLPSGYSRTPHHSFSITDQPTAFDEGWAIHFQGLARRLSVNPRLRTRDLGLAGDTFIALWQSNLDREVRIQGMRQNWFVHQQVVPEGAGDALERREQSTLFDRARLKNAAQMLASEGVVATFFYRHLVPDADGAGLAGRYAPVLRALHAMASEDLAPDTPLVPRLAVALSRTSPEDGRRFVKTLMETSYGALLSPRLADAAEAVGNAGRFGDAEAFVPLLKTARTELAAALAQAQSHPERLVEQAGPGMWVMHPSRKTAGQPLAIDLNTAEREHLLTLPGIDEKRAERALVSRHTDGPFMSVTDFALRAGLNVADTRKLEAMRQALRGAGPFARE